jgi:hypothetical protein
MTNAELLIAELNATAEALRVVTERVHQLRLAIPDFCELCPLTVTVITMHGAEVSDALVLLARTLRLYLEQTR